MTFINSAYDGGGPKVGQPVKVVRQRIGRFNCSVSGITP